MHASSRLHSVATENTRTSSSHELELTVMCSSFRDTQVLLWSSHPRGADRIAQIVDSTGINAIQVQDLKELQNCRGPSVALVGLGESPFDADTSLSAVQQLKTSGCKIIAYAPSLLSWPM